MPMFDSLSPPLRGFFNAAEQHVEAAGGARGVAVAATAVLGYFGLKVWRRATAQRRAARQRVRDIASLADAVRVLPSAEDAAAAETLLADYPELAHAVRTAHTAAVHIAPHEFAELLDAAARASATVSAMHATPPTARTRELREEVETALKRVHAKAFMLLRVVRGAREERGRVVILGDQAADAESMMDDVFNTVRDFQANIVNAMALDTYRASVTRMRDLRAHAVAHARAAARVVAEHGDVAAVLQPMPSGDGARA